MDALPELKDIARRRRRLGITQKALAMASQTSQSLIAKVEKGKLVPSYEIARKIFAALEHMEKKDEVTASKIMTKRVMHVDSSDTLANAMKLMRHYDVSQMPVFRKSHAIGSISEQTITELALKEDLKKTAKKPVNEIMDGPFPQISEETPLSAVVPLLKHNQAVLVTQREKITGIVTKADLMK